MNNVTYLRDVQKLKHWFYLRHGSISIYGKFYLCYLYHFRLFSGLCIVQIWSIKNALRFGSVKKHKNCLHSSVFSTNINRKIILNCSYFLSYYCCSVNYMTWVSKFYNFSDMLRNRSGVYLRAFSIVSYKKFNSNFPVLFIAFFIWSVNCSSHFLLVSKLYELSTWFH